MKTCRPAIVVLLAGALGAAAAGQSTKLHPPLDGGRDVVRYEMSRDGKYVV